MAFCQNCGSEVTGRYCARCGAPSGQGAGTDASAPSIPPASSGASGLADNVASALCYLPILGIIFLLVEPYSRNKLVRFHAFQSLFLTAAMVAINIVLGSVFEILWTGLVFFPLVRLLYLVLVIYLAFQAFKGQKIVTPVIGPLAEKQA